MMQRIMKIKSSPAFDVWEYSYNIYNICPYHFTDTTASTLTRYSEKTVKDLQLF